MDISVATFTSARSLPPSSEEEQTAAEPLAISLIYNQPAGRRDGCCAAVAAAAAYQNNQFGCATENIKRREKEEKAKGKSRHCSAGQIAISIPG